MLQPTSNCSSINLDPRCNGMGRINRSGWPWLTFPEKRGAHEISSHLVSGCQRPDKSLPLSRDLGTPGSWPPSQLPGKDWFSRASNSWHDSETEVVKLTMPRTMWCICTARVLPWNIPGFPGIKPTNCPAKPDEASSTINHHY